MREGTLFFTRGIRLLGTDLQSAGRLFTRAAAGASLKPREVCPLFRAVFCQLQLTTLLSAGWAGGTSVGSSLANVFANVLERACMPVSGVHPVPVLLALPCIDSGLHQCKQGCQRAHCVLFMCLSRLWCSSSFADGATQSYFQWQPQYILS